MCMDGNDPFILYLSISGDDLVFYIETNDKSYTVLFHISTDCLSYNIICNYATIKLMHKL